MASTHGVAGMLFKLYRPLCPVHYVLHLQLHTFHIHFTRVFLCGVLYSCPSLSYWYIYHSSYHVPFFSFLDMSVPLSLFSVIFFVIGATFTNPLTCSFMILSFFVTPHIHLIIIISWTSWMRWWCCYKSNDVLCFVSTTHFDDCWWLDWPSSYPHFLPFRLSESRAGFGNSVVDFHGNGVFAVIRRC